MKKFWVYEKTYILMYKEYIIRKDSQNKNYIDKNKSPYEKIKIMADNVGLLLNENWEEADNLLLAKKNLVIGLMYLNILKFNSGAINIHTIMVKLKK